MRCWVLEVGNFEIVGSRQVAVGSRGEIAIDKE